MGRAVQAIIFALALVTASCSYKESREPLYKPEPLKVNEISFTQWVQLPEQKIKKNSYLKFVDKVGGWIPILGEVVSKIFELPLYVSLGLMPQKARTRGVNLDFAEGDMAEQTMSSLDKISGLRIIDGFLQVAESGRALPIERLEDWVAGDREQVDKPPLNAQVAFDRKEGKDKELLHFADEVQIYFIFPDTIAPVVISIARANWERDYNEQTQMLRFHSTGVNLRSLLLRYGPPRVRILAVGRPPQVDTHLHASFLIDIQVYANGKSDDDIAPAAVILPGEAPPQVKPEEPVTEEKKSEEKKEEPKTRAPEAKPQMTEAKPQASEPPPQTEAKK